MSNEGDEHDLEVQKIVRAQAGGLEAATASQPPILAAIGKDGTNPTDRKAKIEALFSDLMKDLNEMEALEEGIKAKLASRSSHPASGVVSPPIGVMKSRVSTPKAPQTR